MQSIFPFLRGNSVASKLAHPVSMSPCERGKRSMGTSYLYRKILSPIHKKRLSVVAVNESIENRNWESYRRYRTMCRRRRRRRRLRGREGLEGFGCVCSRPHGAREKRERSLQKLTLPSATTNCIPCKESFTRSRSLWENHARELSVRGSDLLWPDERRQTTRGGEG